MTLPDSGRWVHRLVTFPAIVWARGEGSVFRRLRELEATQWLSADALRDRQDARLARIIELAAERSPFYRREWRLRVPVTGATARPLLADLPLVTKAQLQDQWREMLMRPRPWRVTRKITGGSTGQAVTVVKDRAATAAEMAATWLCYGWFGIRIGDRAVRFWGVPSGARKKLLFALADFAMHRIRFSAFAFGEAELAAYWDRCLRFRPDYFYGYVSMLEALARFVEASGRNGRALGLKAVVTTSEVLAEPQRQLLQRAFGAPVQNEYGCGEVGTVACECERGSLHVMAENQVVEILSAEGRPVAEGETGEIVITDLSNVALPLVRYRLGDMGVPGPPCACGRGFPVLERVWGRSYDFVEGVDGRRYHGEFFMYLFEDLRSSGVGVAQFQVVQRARDALDVRIVHDAHRHPDAPERVRRAIEERLTGMHVSVAAVEAIERRPSGKMVVVENTWQRST